MDTQPTQSRECFEIESLLGERWVEGSIGSAPEERVGEHLSSCARCRNLAEEIRRVDVSLTKGFHALPGFVEPPALSRIEATIERLRTDSHEAVLIRKVRRPFRLVLWGVFYAFTLVACCALAVAIYKALAKLP